MLKVFRSERITAGLRRALLLASGRTIKSTYLIRTRLSSESGLCSTGSGLSDFAANANEFARIDNSPLFEVITSPVTETMSPKSISVFHISNWSSPILSSENIACSSVPSPSRKFAKHNFPVSRLKITRPVTDSIIPVETSIGKSLCFDLISESDEVLGTATGYGSAPRFKIAARFSRRILNCSGRSSSSAIMC